jgi:ATP-dependent DNA helicase PIF1
MDSDTRVGLKRLQVVVTGDFFQLPPVTKSQEDVKFAFETDGWKRAFKHSLTLTKVFRQRDEGENHLNSR